MEPSPSRSSLNLAGAGSTLIGGTLAVIAVAAFVGWLLGNAGYGFLAGTILGIPVGVYATYKRYGHAL
jgi:hypothetical protein